MFYKVTDFVFDVFLGTLLLFTAFNLNSIQEDYSNTDPSLNSESEYLLSRNYEESLDLGSIDGPCIRFDYLIDVKTDGTLVVKDALFYIIDSSKVADDSYFLEFFKLS